MRPAEKKGATTGTAVSKVEETKAASTQLRVPIGEELPGWRPGSGRRATAAIYGPGANG